MNDQQKSFLVRRLMEVSREQPEIIALREKLLEIGGVEIVALPDEDIPSLVRKGEMMDGPVTRRPMRVSRCHHNVADLWRGKRKRSRIIAIATGYALSDDGLWRQHSWALTNSGIIETTEPRVRYFGVTLSGQAANIFCGNNE
jgi:hypothetical protein